MKFEQIFGIVRFAVGLGLIVLSVLFLNNNIYVLLVGGLIIIVSGVNVHLIIYQTPKTTKEIKDSLNKAIKMLERKK